MQEYVKAFHRQGLRRVEDLATLDADDVMDRFGMAAPDALRLYRFLHDTVMADEQPPAGRPAAASGADGDEDHDDDVVPDEDNIFS